VLGLVELAAAMGSSVVVGFVLGHDQPPMSSAEDQHPVGDFAPGRCARSVPRRHWITPSITPCPDDRYRRVRVTHRVHPLFGRDFEFVAHPSELG